MIYLNLKGGLCNMLFQIAAAKSLSLEKNTNFSIMNLDEHLQMLYNSSSETPTFIHSLEYKKLRMLSNVLTEKPKNDLPRYEYPFEYAKYNIPNDDYIIDGFFQTEKYFLENKEVIRELFSPTDEINEIINQKYSDLLKFKTTSIHVRRGDYLKKPDIHPTQTMDYYNEGIRLTKHNTEKFIVFSDDINWCKENFKSDNFVFIENEKDYIELYLMSKCDNNIMSNSSFSWWGAWLNNNINKIVVGPSNWFGPTFWFFNTKDILPSNWFKI